MGSADQQGPLWGRRARDWAYLQAPMSGPLWERMLEAGKVSEGTAFLDAGCGSGGASMRASWRGAAVTGLDASEGLLALARKRVPEGTFRQGDLEALPFEDGRFDASFAATSLMLTEDMEVAARELGRVTEPGGRVVAGVWAEPEKCDMRRVFKAIREAVPEPPPGGPFALSEEGALTDLLEHAGLEVTEVEEVPGPFEYPDFGVLWRALRAAGPMQGAIQMSGEKRIRQAVREASEPFETEAGIRLENQFKYALARA